MCREIGLIAPTVKALGGRTRVAAGSFATMAGEIGNFTEAAMRAAMKVATDAGRAKRR
jgi:hypothetical protein